MVMGLLSMATTTSLALCCGFLIFFALIGSEPPGRKMMLLDLSFC